MYNGYTTGMSAVSAVYAQAYASTTCKGQEQLLAKLFNLLDIVINSPVDITEKRGEPEKIQRKLNLVSLESKFSIE